MSFETNHLMGSMCIYFHWTFSPKHGNSCLPRTPDGDQAKFQLRRIRRPNGGSASGSPTLPKPRSCSRGSIYHPVVAATVQDDSVFFYLCVAVITACCKISGVFRLDAVQTVAWVVAGKTHVDSRSSVVMIL
ncbi:hypothetical protein ACQ4PT_057655 [Festuca glaucescens]